MESPIPNVPKGIHLARPGAAQWGPGRPPELGLPAHLAPAALRASHTTPRHTPPILTSSLGGEG